MNNHVIKDFVRRIPKTDLHVHLDGSLRISTLIDLAKAGKVTLPSYDEMGMRENVFKDKYANLGEYLKGFAYTCAVLQKEDNLERVAYEFAQDNIAENVRYVEVRFAPQLHVHDKLTLYDVVLAVCKGLDKAAKEHNNSPEVQGGKDLPFRFGIILCAMRCFNRYMSPWYDRLFQLMPYAPAKEVFRIASLELVRAADALAHRHGLPVVGFDLAGEEAGYPSVDHREAYQYAMSHFIKKTVHAGEAYGPESIFQAITECHANRIGHGTFLFAADMIRDPSIKDRERYCNDLAEYIATQRINIEVCPTSNLQTVPEITIIHDHPVERMLQQDVSVSICTDNRLVSNTTVTKELLLVLENIPLARQKLRNLILAGFKGSFFPGSYKEKRAYVHDVIARYDAIEKELSPFNQE